MKNKSDLSLNINFNTPLYSIGIVAELLNVSVHTIRLYENEGLIIPFKKDSKHRLFTQNDVLRLKCIIIAIRDNKFSISAIKTIFAMIPCWKIKNCSNENRKNCEAFKGHLMPCWTLKHNNNICSLQLCNQCEVYINHTNCENIKETIKAKTT